MFQNLVKVLVPLSKYNILKIKVIFWYFKRKYVYNILESEIIKLMESHVDKKTVELNRRKHKKDPWITFGILRSVNKIKM